MRSTCGFKPTSPDSGAYGHWVCTRGRFHLGGHRYINYVIGRARWRFWWATWFVEASRVLVDRHLRGKPWAHLRSARDRAFHKSARFAPLPIERGRAS